jgi:2-haloacid dehalogenase
MTTAVFDLGGVVLIWDPVPAVAAVVGQARAERFVRGGGFDFAAWNHAQDAGRSHAGMDAVQFTDAAELFGELRRRGLLD